MVNLPQRHKNGRGSPDFLQDKYDGDSTKPSDPGLSVTSPDAATFERPSESVFREDASLVMTFQSTSDTLVIQPSPLMALGRGATNVFKIEMLDLTPYKAHEHGVSRLHAVLHRSSQTLAIADLESTNGTYVNGQRVKTRETQVLHDGDEIRLGKLVIQIKFQ